MGSEQDNTIMRQKLLMELNEKILKQKKELDAQLEDLIVEKEHIETEKKKIEERNIKLWEQSEAIHREKEHVDKLKQEVELRHQEVLDSISYAKRIQSAILPLEQEISKALPQYFVYFQPRDIVSGDFYWFNVKDEKIFLAAVDCTGHGVPGAFMSMVGHILLDEIVLQKGFTEPGKILNELDNNVRTVLRQDNQDTSTRDGMDICLCIIDKEQRTIEYAGANRPLWIVKKFATEIVEIKPTKTAIGGLREEAVTFLSTTLQLNEGDTFYLSSDGYADQFSSLDKKMMTKRFKEALLSIQDKNLDEQGAFLKEFHLNWKGNMEQTDDILVIGVKF
jgi:serine phosphatase RsbU (regulator of sigma subunit)